MRFSPDFLTHLDDAYLMRLTGFSRILALQVPPITATLQLSGEGVQQVSRTHQPPQPPGAPVFAFSRHHFPKLNFPEIARKRLGEISFTSV